MDQIFLTFFKNYCMFKTSTKQQKKKKRERKNYTKDIYYSNQFLPISVVYCSQKKKRKKKIFKTSIDFHKISTINRQTKQHIVAIVVM